MTPPPKQTKATSRVRTTDGRRMRATSRPIASTSGTPASEPAALVQDRRLSVILIDTPSQTPRLSTG
eukprot:7886228-Pyramimonas_sp.AAC.2